MAEALTFSSKIGLLSFQVYGFLNLLNSKSQVAMKRNCHVSTHALKFPLHRKLQFLIDFYMLPISRADIVLGTKWLKMLRPIIPRLRSSINAIPMVGLSGISTRVSQQQDQRNFPFTIRRLHNTKFFRLFPSRFITYHYNRPSQFLLCGPDNKCHFRTIH